MFIYKTSGNLEYPKFKQVSQSTNTSLFPEASTWTLSGHTSLMSEYTAGQLSASLKSIQYDTTCNRCYYSGNEGKNEVFHMFNYKCIQKLGHKPLKAALKALKWQTLKISKSPQQSISTFTFIRGTRWSALYLWQIQIWLLRTFWNLIHLIHDVWTHRCGAQGYRGLSI